MKFSLLIRYRWAEAKIYGKRPGYPWYRLLDPACGSSGMFVSSARFVSEHRKNPAAELSIHGVEKTDEKPDASAA